MKNKGFTLVELLAVIAILAILVIIALPNVMGMFNTAKKNSFLTEVKKILSVAESQWINNSTGTSTNKSFARVANKNCQSQLQLSGRTNLQYYVELNSAGKVVKFYITDGTYQYKHDGVLTADDIKEVQTIANIEEKDVFELSCSGIPKVKFVLRQNSNQITPGDEISIGTHNFYIVKSNSAKTLIITKYLLNTSTIEQVTSNPNILAFSPTNYWNGKVGEGKEYDGVYCSSSGTSNCAYVYNNQSSLAIYVNSYASKISSILQSSVSGRLLKLEEFNELKNGNTYASNAAKSTGGVNYWLGTGNGSFFVYCAKQDNSLNGSYYTNTYGVRPVLEINTSNLD